MRLASILGVLLMFALALRGTAPPPPLEGPVSPPPKVGGPSILIEKAARRLVLYRDGAEVRRFRVGLGFSPVGRKEREGDGKTPEGRYRVCMKNPKSSYHLSLGISYPNGADADRALADGTINRAQRNGIRAADRGRGCTPWGTPLGGDIFIHGSGSSSDWTLGCVALDDPEIEFLYARCPVGTPVEIRP